MKFRFETPCCIPMRKVDDKYPKYLHPNDDSEFSSLFIRNLLSKYQSSPITKNNPIPIGKTTLKVLSKPKSVLISIKDENEQKRSKVRGYIFDFELTAPKELIEIGYYAGYGTKGSIGFGMAELL